jgi:DNA-binding MarR family transcriptional regulator
MVTEQLPNERERVMTLIAACPNVRLRNTSRIVSEFYDAMFVATGLHSNQIALLVPPYLTGGISMNVMAQRLRLDRTTLARNLKLIQEKQLVTVEPDPNDQRVRIVKLTDAGYATLRQGIPLWEEAYQKVAEHLGSQLSELMAILEDLRKIV